MIIAYETCIMHVCALQMLLLMLIMPYFLTNLFTPLAQIDDIEITIVCWYCCSTKVRFI